MRVLLLLPLRRALGWSDTTARATSLRARCCTRRVCCGGGAAGLFVSRFLLLVQEFPYVLLLYRRRPLETAARQKLGKIADRHALAPRRRALRRGGCSCGGCCCGGCSVVVRARAPSNQHVGTVDHQAAVAALHDRPAICVRLPRCACRNAARAIVAHATQGGVLHAVCQGEACALPRVLRAHGDGNFVWRTHLPPLRQRAIAVPAKVSQKYREGRAVAYSLRMQPPT